VRLRGTKRAAMFARIAVWEPMSEDDRRRVVLAAKSIAGVRDA
jgi:hypothetical protein